jgi:glutamine---fructose-6-phosphate transaminase (isomerizing)
MNNCPTETDPEKLVTHLLRDILRQPDELQRTFDYLANDSRPTLGEAADAIRSAQHVYVTGMGSSWHAALNAASLFHTRGFPVHTPDAAELLEFDDLPANSAMIVISRTGRTVEVVNLLHKARRAGAVVVGITNSADDPLAREAQLPIVVPVAFDHAVSVNTYSTLSAAAGALASAALGTLDDSRVASLSRAIAATASTLTEWQDQIAQTPWLQPGSTYYFLARRSSLGSCHEARLLWEEAAKSPATALGTGNFRHGPQEIVTEKVRVGLWIDGDRMRHEDLAVARDLRQLGALVMLIGQDLPRDCGDLVFQLPHIDREWQFLVDIIPAQLAAEQLARLSGVDCDSFRLCSYIVEDECGLLREDQSVPKSAG